MEVYTNAKKPRASVGRETSRRRPKDNIDLDMEDAERLGYGCQYGRFKAAHPHTKAANEDRLHPKKKKQEQQVQPDRQVYENVCPVCGKKFTTANPRRAYCSDDCKRKKRQQAKQQKTKGTPNKTGGTA